MWIQDRLTGVENPKIPGIQPIYTIDLYQVVLICTFEAFVCVNHHLQLPIPNIHCYSHLLPTKYQGKVYGHDLNYTVLKRNVHYLFAKTMRSLN